MNFLVINSVPRHLACKWSESPSGVPNTIWTATRQNFNSSPLVYLHSSTCTKLACIHVLLDYLCVYAKKSDNWWYEHTITEGRGQNNWGIVHCNVTMSQGSANWRPTHNCLVVSVFKSILSNVGDIVNPLIHSIQIVTVIMPQANTTRFCWHTAKALLQMSLKFMLTHHTKAVNTVAVSPEGSFLLSGGEYLHCIPYPCQS